jgi:hypothetical protein
LLSVNSVPSTNSFKSSVAGGFIVAQAPISWLHLSLCTNRLPKFSQPNMVGQRTTTTARYSNYTLRTQSCETGSSSTDTAKPAPSESLDATHSPLQSSTGSLRRDVTANFGSVWAGSEGFKPATR